MKRTVKTVDRYTYIIEEFNSFNELITTNDGREENFHESGGRRKGDDGWCGASYDEAVEMLLHGWEDKEKLNYIMEKTNELNKMHESSKIGFKNDIVGYAPIVPLALKGVPQNMINTVRTPKKAKVIKIYIDVGMASHVTVNEKLEWGAKVTSKIMNLEKQGFRVKIECIKTFAQESGDKVHVCKIPVKNENQPFDIKRIMFPIAHPAMNRRIMFDWYGRLPEAYHYYGFGKSLQYWDSSKADKVKKVIADTESSYYISIVDNIDEILKAVA